MKLFMICACLVAMILFSASAVAEILDWGEGRTSGSVSASASYGNEYDPEGDSSDSGQYTTVAGYFDFWYATHVDIEGYANPVGGWARSVAAASADAGWLGPYLYYDTGDTYTYKVYDPTPLYLETPTYNDYFEAYTGVWAYWQVDAVCQIEEGTNGNTYAWAYAYAQAHME